MQIDAQTVTQVAKLAHLKLSTEEVIYYQNHLESILGYVQQLDKMPQTAPEENLETVVHEERNDLDLLSLGAETAVIQAPEKSGTYFQVPRIIE